MKNEWNERGEGRIGLVLALAIAVVAIFIGVKVVPLKMALFTFSDKIEQRLQRATWRTYEQGHTETLEYIKNQAEQTGYPTEKLKIDMPAPKGGQMKVTIDWDIPLDFAVTQYVWKYHLEKTAPVLSGGG